MIVMLRWLLIAGILVTTPMLVYLSASVFRTKQAWLRVVTREEQQLEVVQLEVEQLKLGGSTQRKIPYSPEMGVPTAPDAELANAVGLKQIQAALTWWTNDRGRIFQGTPGALDPATQGTTITIVDPVPHQIVENSTLYAFDSRDRASGGRYLGAFLVKAAVVPDDNSTTNTIDVVPANALSDTARQQLTQAVGGGAPWILCATMPTDRHVIFQGKSEDELRALLPADSVNEYLRDGSDAEPSDPPENVNAGKFLRPLRDYVQIFHQFQSQRPRLDSALLAINNDAAAMVAAQTLLDGQLKARMDEEVKVAEEIKTAQADLDSVKQARDALEAEITRLREENEALAAKTRQMADELVKAQERAAARVTGGSVSPAGATTAR